MSILIKFSSATDKNMLQSVTVTVSGPYQECVCVCVCVYRGGNIIKLRLQLRSGSKF